MSIQYLMEHCQEGLSSLGCIADVGTGIKQQANLVGRQVVGDFSIVAQQVSQRVGFAGFNLGPGGHAMLADAFVHSLAVGASAGQGHEQSFSGGKDTISRQIARHGSLMHHQPFDNAPRAAQHFVSDEKDLGQD
jgi:hypothetical protein